MAPTKWIAVPLVAGKHIETENGEFKQDGFIACILFFLVLIAFGFSIVISTLVMKDKPQALSKGEEYYFIVGYMLTACLLIGCMCVLRVGDPSKDQIQDTRNKNGTKGPRRSTKDRIRHFIKQKLSLIGIVGFFLPCVFFDVFAIAASADCTEEIVKHCESDEVRENISTVVFHCCRMLFMGFLVGFALFFHGKCFRGSIITVRYILVFIIASTLVMWFENFIHDFVHIFGKEGDKKHVQCPSLTLYAEDNSFNNIRNNTKLYKCLHENNTEFNVLQTMESYFYPFNIEFALLMVEIVAHLFVSPLGHANKTEVQNMENEGTREGAHQTQNECPPEGKYEDQTTHPKQIVASVDVHPAPHGDRQDFTGPLVDLVTTEDSTKIKSRSPSPTSDKEGTKREDSTESSKKVVTKVVKHVTDHRNEKNRLKQHGEPTSYGSMTSTASAGSTQNTVHAEVQTSGSTVSNVETGPVDRRPAILYTIAICAIILSVVLVTLSLQDFLYKGSVQHLQIYFSYQCFFNVLSILFMFHAFGRSEGFLSNFQPFSGLEMIVVMSSGGFFLHAFMSMTSYIAAIPGINNTNQVPNSTLTAPLIAAAFCDKLTDIIAMLLQTILMIHATRITAPEGDHVTQKIWLKVTLMYIAIANLTTWAIDSFIEINHVGDVDAIQNAHYGKPVWYLITHLTLPFVIFYHFNSFFMLIGGFLDH